MSKGDNPRPLYIPLEEFEERWEQTFGCREMRTDNDNCHGSGTTCWYCECGEVLDSRKARDHECEEDEDV